jgi:hypothetical protein
MGGCSSKPSNRVVPEATSPSALSITDAPPSLAVVDATEKAEFVADIAITAASTAQEILAKSPPGIVDDLASGASGVAEAAGQYSAAIAPGLATFIGMLCGTAADLLGAIAPAIPFAGAAVAAFGKLLEQGDAYVQAMQAADALKQTLRNRRPTIEQFAGQAALASQHCSLVGHAAQTLRDAVKLLAKSYSEGRSSLRKEVRGPRLRVPPISGCTPRQ